MQRSLFFLSLIHEFVELQSTFLEQYVIHAKPRGFQRVIFSFPFLFSRGSKYRDDTNKHPSIKHVFHCDLYIKFVEAQYRYLPHLGSCQHGESLVVGVLRSSILSFPCETTENS